jgi:hypothetical protein
MEANPLMGNPSNFADFFRMCVDATDEPAGFGEPASHVA